MVYETFSGAFSQTSTIRKTFDVTIHTPGPGAYAVSKDIKDAVKQSFPKNEKLVLKLTGNPPLG
jgi:hypothetical protein